MYHTTKRFKVVEVASLKLAAIDMVTIVHEVNKLLNDKALYESMSQVHTSYRNGKACLKIVNLIKENYAK